jgi:hypothetical protein
VYGLGRPTTPTLPSVVTRKSHTKITRSACSNCEPLSSALSLPKPGVLTLLQSAVAVLTSGGLLPVVSEFGERYPRVGVAEAQALDVVGHGEAAALARQERDMRVHAGGFDSH